MLGDDVDSGSLVECSGAQLGATYLQQVGTCTPHWKLSVERTAWSISMLRLKVYVVLTMGTYHYNCNKGVEAILPPRPHNKGGETSSRRPRWLCSRIDPLSSYDYRTL